ncbi:MAG: Hsp20 family protein [Caldithrix sp.]|nr:Hsp20 family protein [Caldithrix sp.]
MPIPRRFPFVGRHFMNLKSDLDRIYDEFFGDEDEEPGSGFIPPVNIEETGSDFIITAELPGVRKEDVSITLQDDKLVLSGRKHTARDEQKDNFLRYERLFGRFNRKFNLPEAIQTNNIDAVFEDGVLKITVPKAKESQSRKINIDIK